MKGSSGRELQHGDDTIAILHVGRMADDPQQEAERIDENMPLAARKLLSRILPAGVA